ncbi:MAG: hypothetical protein AAFO95_12040 [Cyanobacteria bacterium J06600_6]
MPIYRSKRPARILSRQEKLDLFCNCTVVHPHLKKLTKNFAMQLTIQAVHQ